MHRSALRTFLQRALLATLPLGAAGCPVIGSGCPIHTTEVRIPDGGVPDALDDAGCTRACEGHAGTLLGCHREDDGGAARVACSVSVPCLGRRPEALAPLPAIAGGEIGRAFAEAAWLEAASVPAFERLAAELRAHGAPERLARLAERAARDEARHARMQGALARRYGAEPAAPSVGPLPIRALVEVAVENAGEGCVRETFGALTAGFQARTAADAEVRRALAAIADDETRHAELAWAVDAWAKRRLSITDRERVNEARKAAACSLAAGLASPPVEVARAAGLPEVASARRLLDACAPLFG